MKFDPKWKDFWLEFFRTGLILTFIVGGMALIASVSHPSSAYMPSDDGRVAEGMATQKAVSKRL